jgi:cytochrome c556
MRTAIVLATVTFGLSACVTQRNVGVEEIPKLTKLEEVMDVQATYADPQFKKIGRTSFDEAEFTAFADAGARLQATALKLKDFSKGAEFDRLALALGEAARALADAASARNAAAASNALADIKLSCKTCHKKFK